VTPRAAALLLVLVACSPKTDGGTPSSDGGADDPHSDPDGGASGDSAAVDGDGGGDADGGGDDGGVADGGGADTSDGGGSDTGGDVEPIVLPDPVIYVTERYAGDLIAIDRSTGIEVWRREGLEAAVGLAVDRDGYIYLGTTDNDDVGSLVRVSSDGVDAEVLIPPDGTLLRPQGLWYDAANHLILLADVNASIVYEYGIDDGSLAVLTDQVPVPSDATRRPGETTTWVTSRSEGRVYKVDDLTGAATALSGDLPDAHSIVPGTGGVLYAMATGSNGLVSVDQTTGEAILLASAFSATPPVGLCLDAIDGGLFIGDHAGSTLHLYDIATGAVAPWFIDDKDLYECGHNRPIDADGDGLYAIWHGGDDCDDSDAGVGALTPC
jgi:PQQ-like domain